MADPTISKDTPFPSRFSSFQPTVSLYDWWLVKAKNDFEGKRLAVAGVSSRKKAVRVFVSAPIVKRYDVFSLETADGVHVIIMGFINEQRTLENGFAPEVFNSFVFGFPPNWESYALECHQEESKFGTDSGNSDMDKEEGMPSSDNVSAICPEILSDGCFGEETKVATDLENVVTDNDGEVPSPDNVFTVCPENLSDGCFGEETKVATDLENAVTDNDGEVPSPDNVFTVCLENLSDGCYGQEESKVGTDQDNAVTDNDGDVPSSDNIIKFCPENLFDGRYGQEESKVATDLENDVTDNDGEVPSPDNVFPVCPENLSDGCYGQEESEVGTDQDNAVTDNDGDVPSSDNIIKFCPENVFDGAKKSNPTLVLPEEAPGNSRKPLPKDECSALKEMSGINAANGIGRTRRSSRLYKHSIKVCQQKQLAAESPPKHPDKDQSTTSAAMENCDGGLGSPSTPIQSQSKELLSTLSEQLVIQSASRISRMLLSAKTEGCNKKKKRIAKTETVNPKRKIIKPASSVKSPQKGDVSHLNRGSKQEIPLDSPESLSLGKSRSGGGRNRCSSWLHSHNFQLIQQKNPQPTTESLPKHPDKDHSSTSAALENCDGGLESPSTPIQSQTKELLNMSEQLVKKSASRFSRTLSAKTEGCNKKSRKIAKTEAVSHKRKTEGCNKKSRKIAKTEAVSHKRKITKPAYSVESPQERDVSHLNKGSKQEIALVSPESLSLRKSRSGRLLLPPLEFWRNQIPIYNADHKVTEIQEGASLASPRRGSPASLSRSNNQKDKRAT